MKKSILLALCSIVLTSSCVNPEEEYSQAYDASIKLPLKQERMGFEFKPDMTRAKAETHLNALKNTGGLVLSMPALGKHEMEEVKLGYFQDTLAVVELKVADSEVYFADIEQMLTERYPGKLYHHNSGENKATSWFTGPIQIQVEHRPESGTWLSYMDMRRYSNHIGESVKELLKEIDEEESQ